MDLSRRDFLSSALVTGAAAGLAGLGVQTAWADDGAAPSLESMQANAAGDNQPKWTWETPPAAIADDQIAETVEADVVIVGAGIAGVVAALYAAEQGAKTVVLEKSGKVVNNRLHTMGFNARVQKEAGIEFDRTDVLKNFWNISNGYQGRLSLYARFFDNSGPFIDWLEGRMAEVGSKMVCAIPSFAQGGGGVQFWPEYATTIFFADPETGMLNVQGARFDWAEAIAELAEKDGAEFVFHAPAKQLVRGGKANGTEGRVEGVIAQKADGTYVRYNASKGVLMATGDFAMNEEMIRAFNPILLKLCDTMAEPNDTGEGHMMAMWCGAGMDDYAGGDLFPMHTATNRIDMRPTPEEDPMYTCVQGLTWRPAVANLPGLIVDPAGRRCGPEDMVFQSFSHVILSTPNGRVWGIFDGAWQDKYKSFGYTERDLMAINTQEEVDKEVEAGLIKKFDTIEELAEGCGMDLAVLQETLEVYNAACKAGEDKQFLKAKKYLASVDTPPFYAAEMGVSITSTRAGLKLDDHIRVCDTKGSPIEGLYAAGNVAGSFYGHVYPSNVPGSGIGHGQTFGWLAVKDMLGIEYL